MPYGTIKVDNITFTDNSVDKTVSLSGLIQNPTFTGNVTVTGTISGDVIRGGTTISGVTVTGTTANFVSGVFTTQVSGATIIATTGTFTSLTGTTTTGTTANFVSGVFTTQVSGATITGTTVSTTTGSFVSLTGTTATFTSGIIASGTAALPSLAILSDPNTGIYSPGADQVAISTNGVGRLFVDASGNVSLNRATPATLGANYTTFTIRGQNNDYGGGIIFESLDGTDQTFLYGDAGAFYAITQDARPLILGTNASERMRLTSAGLLGLGTSTPGEKLDISSGTNGTAAVVKIQDPAGRVLQIASPSASTEAYIGTTTSHRLDFYINNAVKATLDTSGRLGIGTTGPAELLSVNGNLWLGNGGGSGGSEMLRIWNDGGVERIHASNNPSALAFGIGGSSSTYERMRLDSSGRLLVGTSSARTNFFNAASGAGATLQIEGTSYQTSSIALINNEASTSSNALVLAKSRGTAVGSNTIVNSADTIGTISFQGNDGSEFVDAARIEAFVDGTPGANDMPGRLVFSTTADGGSSPTERMRIDTSGNVLIGNTTNTTNRRLNIEMTGGGIGQLGLRDTAASAGKYWTIGPNSSNNLVVYNQASAGVYIVDGGTSWTGTSDERLKTNLKPIENAIDKIATLRAVTGRFVYDSENVSRSFLIAQDVQAVLPEAVSVQDDELGTLGLAYTDVIPLLVAALKESKDRIESLETRLSALEGA